MIATLKKKFKLKKEDCIFRSHIVYIGLVFQNGLAARFRSNLTLMNYFCYFFTHFGTFVGVPGNVVKKSKITYLLLLFNCYFKGDLKKFS